MRALQISAYGDPLEVLELVDIRSRVCRERARS